MTSDSEGSATERRTVGATSDAGPQAPPSTAPATPDVPRPPDRDARGRFADRNQVGARTQFSGGNWAAMRHSLDADRWPPGLDVLKEEVEALLAEMLADEGDASDVPARRRSLLTIAPGCIDASFNWMPRSSSGDSSTGEANYG